MFKIKDNYLWSISAIYLFAFSSLYTQIEGLYGDDGVLPVRAFAQIDKRGVSALLEAFLKIPSLVWFGPSIGLSLNSTMELITIIGMIISFMQLISASFREFSMYVILFVLYFSMFQIGQTFLSFQWDILLLESGFLTIFVSPIHFPFIPREGPHDSLTLWTIRWLLFRLMFASGVVKLTSGCSTWWGLTALNVHFESQCLPTPMSWYAHHLPDWILRLSVIGTYIVEIIVPFLFFVPIKHLRLFAFWSQIAFQLIIIITGNYTFFNLLTMSLCWTILNDNYLNHKFNDKWIQSLITVFIYFAIIYWTIVAFEFGKISFELSQFKQFLRIAIPASIGIASVSLCANITVAIFRCITMPLNILNRIRYLLMTIVFSWFAIYMFGVSLVPHTSLDATQTHSLWPIVKQWHKSADGFHIVNSYGLFRRMTGVNGRPELVIEGSNDLTNGWKEYHFMYKPGDVANAPIFIIPHQPRLDWQMWFAALDNYQNNPWLLHLSYRLLTNQNEVIELLDRDRLPFKKAPKYIRIRIYKYRYTELNSTNWWQRSDVREYMSPVSKESLKDFLSQNGIEPQKRVPLNDQYAVISNVLKGLRNVIRLMKPHIFVRSLFVTAFIIARF